MESIQWEQLSNAGSRLGVSSLQNQMSFSQRHLFPDLCVSSSFRKVADESLLYVSGILDNTMNPSFISSGPGPTADLTDQLKTKKQDVTLESAKVAFKSLLSIPVIQEINSQTSDLSISITSAQNVSEDHTNITETNSKSDGVHYPDSTSCTARCDIKGESNSTFDMAKDLKEMSSELNCTKSLLYERTNNVTFEKSAGVLSSAVSPCNEVMENKHEKHLNSSVNCAPANVTTDKLVEKHDCTVDITQSNVPKHGNSETHDTLTKAIGEINASVELIADVQKNSRISNVLAKADQSSSVNVEKADVTFTKHNTTTDLTPSGPILHLTATTKNMTKTTTEDLPVQSSTNGDAALKNTPTAEHSHLLSTAGPVSVEVAVSSNRTLVLPLPESKREEQDILQRRNGVSDGESCSNLDISHSSMFSLDDMLDMKPCPLVASTPIVLGKGFDRLGSAKPTDEQRQLSVINSIDSHLSDTSVGVTRHNKSDDLKTNPPFKSETSSQRQKGLAKDTSNSSTSESAVGSKLPSKFAVRRKIPQPSFKSAIPKTQIPARPLASQTLPADKSKNLRAVQAVNQPDTFSSTVHSTGRTVLLNKGKCLAPPKTTATVSTVKTSSSNVSTSGCNLPSNVKAVNSFKTQLKPSGLQLCDRGRFGLKPPNGAICSEETGQPGTSNKLNGISGIRTRSLLLPGFSQKHTSSDALPMAKRKKTDTQNQPVCLDHSKPGREAQKQVTALTDTRPKKPSGDCGNCLLLQEKLQTFHQDLGEYLDRRPADCETWMAFQQTFETWLKEFKRIQRAHQ